MLVVAVFKMKQKVTVASPGFQPHQDITLQGLAVLMPASVQSSVPEGVQSWTVGRRPPSRAGRPSTERISPRNSFSS